MSISKQIKQVKFGWYDAANSTSQASDTTISIQNMDIMITHDNPSGNPMFSTSLNGTKIPYSVKCRYKFVLSFDRSIEESAISELFDNLISYNKPGYYIRFYRNASDSEYKRVWLDTPMEIALRYKNTIGIMVPSISLISADLATSIDTDFYPFS